MEALPCFVWVAERDDGMCALRSLIVWSFMRTSCWEDANLQYTPFPLTILAVISRRYLSRSWFDFTGLPGDNRTGDRWISAMQ